MKSKNKKSLDRSKIFRDSEYSYCSTVDKEEKNSIYTTSQLTITNPNNVEETIMKTVIMDRRASDECMPYAEFCSFILITGVDSMIGKYWHTKKQKIEIGRHRKCDICIPESSISKKHVTVCVTENQQVYISDQHSTNGTSVNDVRLEPGKEVMLNDNDLIAVGNIILRFLDRTNPEIASVASNFKRAFTDSLTGVGNRLMLETCAPELFAHNIQRNKCLTAIIFDIDNFKKVNDTYGHLAGDFVLKQVAQLGMSCFRVRDLFVRAGGEEFCIFLSSSVEKSRAAIEKVRKKIEEKCFQYQEHQMRVTISAGIATLKDQDSDWKQIYQRADEALYAAKTGGRNRVCVAGETKK